MYSKWVSPFVRKTIHIVFDLKFREIFCPEIFHEIFHEMGSMQMSMRKLNSQTILQSSEVQEVTMLLQVQVSVSCNSGS